MKRFIVSSLCIILAACSSTQNPHFPSGAPTSAPYGYTEFCKREPDQCSTDREPAINVTVDTGKSKDSSENPEEGQ